MAKKIVTIIKEDALLNIEISGSYYQRVYDLFTRILEKQPDVKQTILNIESKETILSLSEATIQILLMLLKTIETEANKDLKKNTKEVEVEVNEGLSEN